MLPRHPSLVPHLVPTPGHPRFHASTHVCHRRPACQPSHPPAHVGSVLPAAHVLQTRRRRRMCPQPLIEPPLGLLTCMQTAHSKGVTLGLSLNIIDCGAAVGGERISRSRGVTTRVKTSVGGSQPKPSPDSLVVLVVLPWGVFLHGPRPPHACRGRGWMQHPSPAPPSGSPSGRADKRRLSAANGAPGLDGLAEVQGVRRWLFPPYITQGRGEEKVSSCTNRYPGAASLREREWVRSSTHPLCRRAPSFFERGCRPPHKR